ncbi:hypothetical protein [Vibrio phage phiKT1024]|nr:hypothetical protein [Vibrio phage phiKT1024]
MFKEIPFKEEYTEKGISIQDVIEVARAIEQNCRFINESKDDLMSFHSFIRQSFPLFENPFRDVVSNLSNIQTIRPDLLKILDDISLAQEFKRKAPQFRFEYYFRPQHNHLTAEDIIKNFNKARNEYFKAADMREELLLKHIGIEPSFYAFWCSKTKRFSNNRLLSSTRTFTILNCTDPNEDDPSILVKSAYVDGWNASSYSQYKSRKELERNPTEAEWNYLKTMWPERYI